MEVDAAPGALPEAEQNQPQVEVLLQVKPRVKAQLEVDTSGVAPLPFDTHAMRQSSFWQQLASVLYSHPQHQQQQLHAPLLGGSAQSHPPHASIMHQLVALLPPDMQTLLHAMAQLQGHTTAAAAASSAPALPVQLHHAQICTAAGVKPPPAATTQQPPPPHVQISTAAGAKLPKAKLDDKKPVEQQHDAAPGVGGKRARKAQIRAQNGQLEASLPAGVKKGVVPEPRKRRKKAEATGG
eukprot:scaffold37918_cov17-Tisochrysis_lutea.AAC.1